MSWLYDIWYVLWYINSHTARKKKGESLCVSSKARVGWAVVLTRVEVPLSSISRPNLWVLFEAGIMCARYEDGRIKPNHYGEKVITLRKWAFLLTPQRVALRRQSVGRAD